MHAMAVYIHKAFAQFILLQVIIGYYVHHEHTPFSKISMPIVYVSQKDKEFDIACVRDQKLFYILSLRLLKLTI